MNESTNLGSNVNNPQNNSSGAANSGAICDSSPPAPVEQVELRLKPSKKYPRQLTVRLLLGHTLWVDLQVGRAICSSAHMLLTGCYLSFNKGCSYLALDKAVFLLSAEEATQVRAMFEPRGLRVLP